MITNLAINAHNFIYCLVYQSANETTSYYNDMNGHYHQWIYLVEGEMDVVRISDTEDNLVSSRDMLPPLQAGGVYNISETRGKYVVTKTKDAGASMIMFNPVPADRDLKIEIVKGSNTREVTATNTRVTIVCITGPIQVNGKELKSNQYAVVFENTSATLTMGETAVCAIVSE